MSLPFLFNYPRVFFSPRAKLRWLCLGLGAVLSCDLRAAPGVVGRGEERSAALAVAANFSVARILDAGSARDIRLLRASLENQRLTLDFSRELLQLGPGSRAFEEFLRPLHRAAAEVLREDFADFEIDTQIGGIPLPLFLAAEPRAAPLALARGPTEIPTPSTQALSTRRIAVSPGHGYYQNANSAWVLQRGYWQGIVEDFVNHDIVLVLRDELAGAGATVLPTRNLDRNAGNGESGFPKWQEAARYHVKALGADPSIWNEPNLTHLDQDIRCRPRWANSVNADVLVSVHNNGGGGTGTETLYDTNNGFGAESKRLADAVHGRVIATLRREYNANWADRRVQGFNGSYGENRLATRPSILIEIAFMDQPTPDNAALQNPAFHRLVARAIREGVEEYFNGPATAPAAPAALIATAGAGAVALGWTDLATNENGFRVERRSGPLAAWESLATLGANVTAYTDLTAAAGATLVYRVAAFNAAGTSAQYSNEVTVLPSSVTITPGPRPGAWLSNISVRTLLAANQTVTVGFFVAGGGQVLVRVAGPGLTAYGVTSTMADPRLDFYRGATLVSTNNDWPAALAPAMAALGAFPFSAASRDAAWFQAVDGAHTVIAGGTGAGTVLVEGYDAGSGAVGRLVNLSARNRVGTANDLLIAGFHVSGTGSKRLLVRAVGPGLTVHGVSDVLVDPKLEIYDAAGALVAAVDNWDAALAPTFASVGAFPLAERSRDAALVLTLPAGRGYTAQVGGVGGTTGEALVEVYELP